MIKYNDNMVVLAIIIVNKMLKRTFFSLTSPPEDELNPNNITLIIITITITIIIIIVVIVTSFFCLIR